MPILYYSMYNNLNPAAGGKYLDTLCALTNIIRQTKTYSTASIIVKNISTTDQTPEFITCIDKVGVEWTWQNPLDGENLSTIIRVDQSISLLFTCDSVGPIDALGANVEGEIDWTSEDKGWINQVIESDKFVVFQNDDAIVGQDDESDVDLKRRRRTIFWCE